MPGIKMGSLNYVLKAVPLPNGAAISGRMASRQINGKRPDQRKVIFGPILTIGKSCGGVINRHD